MNIRAYEARDGAAVAGLLGSDRIVAERPAEWRKSQYVFVVEGPAGEVEGVVVGHIPDGGEEAQLGIVATRRPADWPTYIALLARVIEQAIELGFELGGSTARNPGVVRFLRNRFGLYGEPCGWEGPQRKVVEWHYQVNLRDFLAQLKAAM